MAAEAGGIGPPIRCREFLEGHSEYLDGLMSAHQATRFDLHRGACAACRRYDRVVRQGAELLRHMPEVEPGEDFLPRLQHRIYHVEDEAALDVRGAGTLPALLAVAVVAAVALSPLIRGVPLDADEEAGVTTAATPAGESNEAVASVDARREWSVPVRPSPPLSAPILLGGGAIVPSRMDMSAVDSGEYLRARHRTRVDAIPAGPYSPLVVGPLRFADGPSAPRSDARTPISISLD